MRRTTPALLPLLTLILALLVACGGGTAATTAPQASTAPSSSASAAPSAAPSTSASAAPSTAASAAPSAAPTVAASATRTTTGTVATATRGATAPATATRATGSPVAGPPPRVTGALTIFAAASLTDAFNEMKGRIEAANPGTTLTFNLAASSALRTQLEQGAKADLFASADTAQMDNAKKANLLAGDPSLFVRNTPVIIVPANNPKGIAAPADLAKPGVKLVLAAPAVPIGNYSRQIFDKMSQDPAFGADFGAKALANLVSEEANVRQVVSKVQLGEGDAGIVYSSDVTPAVRDQLKVITIPPAVNVVAEYPVAAIRGGANEAGARAFIAYLLSAEGQAILQKWGFLPVSASGTPLTSVAIGGLVNTPRSYGVAELRALPQVTITAKDRAGADISFSGTPMAGLIQAIGVKPEAKALVFTGADNYQQEVPIEAIRADTSAIIALLDNGTIRNVLPTLAPRFWVSDLIRIEAR